MIFGREQGNQRRIRQLAKQILAGAGMSDPRLHADDGVGQDHEIRTIACVLDGI
jgi:hypothetical protein